MFFKKRPEKEKPLQITKEDFGDYVLSKFILKNGENVDSFFDELNKEGNVTDYLTFLRYHLFLAQKILETKFSKEDALKMVYYAINGIVDMLNFFPDENKEKAKDGFKNEYSVFVGDFDIDITKEQDMHRLTTSFLEEWEIEDTLQSRFYIIKAFMLFIKYHTNDILTNTFELI